MNFSVALQVYSVRDFAEKDLEGSLQKIREMGYDGVELAGLYGRSYAEVKAAVGGYAGGSSGCPERVRRDGL